jgi:hypothetical protein
MARTRTLAQLRGDVEYQGSIAGLVAGGRHPPDNVTRLINQSWQRWRLKVSQVAKLQRFLVTATGTLTPGAVSADEPYTQLTHSLTDVVWIRQVALTVNGEVYQMEEVDSDAIGEYGSHPTTPCVWTSEDETTLLFMPPADAAYGYSVRYLPAATDLSADGDTVDGIAGFEDWIVFDALMNMMVRDDEPEMYQLLQARRDDIWADVMRHSRKGRSGPHKRRDVRTARANLRRHLRWPVG